MKKSVRILIAEKKKLTDEEVKQAVVLDVVDQVAVACRLLDEHRDEVLMLN